MPAQTVEVVEHVVLMLVHVAALPEPVSPLGQESRETGQPAERSQPRRRRGIAQEVHPERPGAPSA